MYRKIAFVLILGLVLVFLSQLGYAVDPHKEYYGHSPYADSNPSDYYDPADYGNPYGNSYPYGYYQQAPPFGGNQWQLHEEQIHKEQEQLHKEYNHGEDF
jgi:hypothetical protein